MLIKDLNNFSQTNKVVSNLVTSNLTWLQVADNYKIKVNQPLNEKSIKAYVKDPWMEIPFGKINQHTYDVLVSKASFDHVYLSDNLDSLDEKKKSFFENLSSLFKQYIPKNYYFHFEDNGHFLPKTTIHLIFYRNESGVMAHETFSDRMTSTIDEFTKKLSITMKCCTGKWL